MVVPSTAKLHVSHCVMDSEQTEDFDMNQTQNAKEESTLFNLGHAPKEVIEKFQVFCFGYSCLCDAIMGLLQRDKLLVRKYRFLCPPVCYQMLVKPTVNDNSVDMKKAMLALRQYARDGKYRLVANAIEELLISPEKKELNVNPDIEDYMMLKPVEQNALSKIADAVVDRIFQLQSEPKRGRQKNPDSELPQMSSLDINSSPGISVGKVRAKPQVLSNSDHTPSVEKSAVAFERSTQDPAQTLCKDAYPMHGNKQSKSVFNSVDVELNIPLERFRLDYKVPDTKLSQLQATAFNKTQNSIKGLFMLNLLGLIPKGVEDFSFDVGPYQYLLSSDDEAMLAD